MLRKATAVAPIKISKTLKIPVLMDVEEMQGLLDNLPESFFYLIQGVCKKEEGVMNAHAFLQIYADYISYLKKGQKPPAAQFRATFASALSVSKDALVSFELDENSHLIKAVQPVIQLQTSRITYSAEEEAFRSQQFGSGGIEWGVQFSYPQLYQDPETQDVLDVDDTFANTEAFRTLQKWIRYNTVATPFIVNGKRINAPIRLGKNCFKWIHSHPDLKGITIHGAA